MSGTAGPDGEDVIDSERLRLVGLGLIAAAALWVLAVAATEGGRPWPLVALLGGAVGAVLLADRVEARWRRAVLWLVAFSPVVTAVVQQRWLFGSGSLGYANASGALALVAATAALVLALSPGSLRRRRFAGALAAVWLVLPWTLGARTAALGGVVLVLALVLLPRLRLRTVVLAGAFIVLLVGTAVIAFGLGYEPGPRSGPVDRVVDASVGELRVLLWSEALEIVADAPVTGVGPGGFQDASLTATAREDARWAHNGFLQMAAETGVPGGLLVVAIVAWSLLYVRTGTGDGRSILVTVALTAVTVNATIDYVWHFAAVPVGLGLLIGATAGLPSEQRSVRPSWLDPPAVVLLATAVLALALLLPAAPLNPAGGAPNGATLNPDTASIVFGEPGLVRSVAPPQPLYERLALTQAFSVELWVATTDPQQDGPARILSSSEGIINRNLTLGQAGEDLSVRLRTTETDWNALESEVTIPGVFEKTALRHVVVTSNLRTMEVFVDGQRWWRGEGPGGRLDSWNHSFPLVLGNEATGERPWLGGLRGVAVHDQVLPAAQVASSFRSGPPDGWDVARPAASLVARYAFGDAATDGTLADSSHRRLGGDLTVPNTMPDPAASLVGSLLTVGGRSPDSIAGHLLVFGLWAGVAAAWLRPRSSGVAVWLGVPAMGVAIVLGVSLLRHEADRVVSGVDVLAALVGCLVGVAAVAGWTLVRHGRGRGGLP